jgi:flavin reductase (DIM6/NTAB) family NADH-FMN oxidoreductase RutF
MADEPFVEVPVRNRFYQSSSFFPLPVVVISTRAEDGGPNLAPYSLLFPDPDPKQPLLHLICRASSKTAANIERTGQAAICFIPDEPRYLANCKLLAKAAPTREKMKRSIFRLVASERAAVNGVAAPDVVREAIQVFECTRDPKATIDVGDRSRHFGLRVERILLKSRWRRALQEGSAVPRLPIDYGFREPTSSWLTRPSVRTDRPRLRPRFETVVPIEPERLLSRVEQYLQRSDNVFVGMRSASHVQISYPESEQRVGSPQLEIEAIPHDEGTLVKARIGPHPNVWTLFVATHAAIAFGGLAAILFGVAQLALGRPPWALLGLVLALGLHAFLAGAAYVGQGLTADQVYRLRALLDDALAGAPDAGSSGLAPGTAPA